MTAGDAFYLNVADSHRYVVAHVDSNPISTIIVFNFTTHRAGRCDETCIITPAEYPDLDADSVIAYRHGLLLQGQELTNFNAVIGKKLPGVKRDVIQKICSGALDSRFTPGKIKRLLRPPTAP